MLHISPHLMGVCSFKPGFLLFWWRSCKTRFLEVKCSENHPPSGCFKFDVQKCPVALETPDDFQPLSPWEHMHAPASEAQENFT